MARAGIRIAEPLAQDDTIRNRGFTSIEAVCCAQTAVIG
jgi:hypothetical protein